MIALVIVSTFVVLVLGILVAGLLRSHADILRSLHELGVGVGDPVAGPPGVAPVGLAAPVAHATPETGPGPGSGSRRGRRDPGGDARAVAVDNSDHLTLLGFLSSGCTSCGAFWDALQEPGRLQLPDSTRVVIVTKGPDREVPAEVRSRTTGRVPVVMSTDAWLDYQVPGSPFFVLVDGATGRKVGQGVASHVGQLAELVRRAEHDRGVVDTGRGRGRGGLAGPGPRGGGRRGAAGRRDPPGRPQPLPADARRRLPLGAGGRRPGP